jgi:aspartate/glutamate racemase
MLILDQLVFDVKAKADMKEIIRKFIITDEKLVRGTEYSIPGCFEIPIIVESYGFAYDFADPTTELAKAAFKACGYSCLQKHRPGLVAS